ncbi:MAG: PTS glucitol/sorbitol transporter subunit IIA, partial [Anaerovibrio sp.]|nr:PTS glucitol/sorbitol transporter subunit IIA [Anaerovibrio sp.]
IYENMINEIGPSANEFMADGMIILFGEGAPEELRESCYIVDVKPVKGTIRAGCTMQIAGEDFLITAVGGEAPVTLKGLGHCTLNFSGQSEPDLPGSIYLEKKPVPDLKIGSSLKIIG